MRKKSTAMIICSLIFSNILIGTAFAGTWKQGINGDPSAWWYDNGDGTFPVSTWQWIDGNGDGIAECYYFDDTGQMLSDTRTPDGYMVDQYGAWTLGFVRRKCVLSPYQIDIFKDVAEGLLNIYEERFYRPSDEYMQLRNSMTQEEAQKLLYVLMAIDAEKHFSASDTETVFTPLRVDEEAGYFDTGKTLGTFASVTGIGLGAENLYQTEQGELIGTSVKGQDRYRITGCEQDSDGSFVYLKMTYEKIDALSSEVTRTGTLYMELYRNERNDIRYTIDQIGNYEMHG